MQDQFGLGQGFHGGVGARRLGQELALHVVLGPQGGVGVGGGGGLVQPVDIQGVAVVQGRPLRLGRDQPRVGVGVLSGQDVGQLLEGGRERWRGGVGAGEGVQQGTQVAGVNGDGLGEHVGPPSSSGAGCQMLIISRWPVCRTPSAR
ncbi:hypothetical protein GCM10023405_21900 [Streptomonospora salina]